MTGTRPDILFILVDQMRGDCLGLTGHPVAETPHLDDLGRHGTVFTRAYTPVPSCVAARASIFTGLSPTQHGRLGYRDGVPWRYPNMLPEVLGNAGYQTYCVGKTHFYPQRAHLGFQGLESYEGAQTLDAGYVNDYWEWLRDRAPGVEEFGHGLTQNAWAARPSHLPEALHNSTWVAARSIEFLRRRDPTRPYFLTMSFHRPHPPFDPPQVYYDMYKDRPIPPPPVGEWAHIHDVPIDGIDAWHGRLPKRDLDAARRAYYALIAHVDGQIGRVLRAIENLGMARPVVVFASDHGDMLGDHCLFRKCYAYEGSARVPLVISRPGDTAGRLVDAPVVLQDLYPTLLNLAGAKVPRGIDGQSLLPWCGDGRPPRRRAWVHGEHAACYTDGESMQYLTDGRMKYIWFTVTGREQLFDLESDPEELYDLSSEPSAQDALALWRARMVEQLAPRTQDGLTDGKRLRAGVRLPAVRPELLDA